MAGLLCMCLCGGPAARRGAGKPRGGGTPSSAREPLLPVQPAAAAAAAGVVGAAREPCNVPAPAPLWPDEPAPSSQLETAEGGGASSEPALSWSAVAYSVEAEKRGQPRRTILRPCDGELSIGVHMMIGPSGAGKSTLLACLAGRKRRDPGVTGAVWLDGEQLSSASRRSRMGHSGGHLVDAVTSAFHFVPQRSLTDDGGPFLRRYVTQDDVLPATSTAAEALRFHARLRCPWLGASQVTELVEATLRALCLTEQTHQTIGDQYARRPPFRFRWTAGTLAEWLCDEGLAARRGGLGGLMG